VHEPHRSPEAWPEGGATGAKLALRDQLLTARRRRSLAEVAEAARAIAEHLLAAEEVRRAAVVACYASVGAEPGTSLLLDRLRDDGKRVLLPVVLPDYDLDWAPYAGPASLLPAGRGLLEPAGQRLGVDAVTTADVVLVPGLAVSPAGMRLGRGAGCYDRALARVPVGTFTCVLLYEEETDVEVPFEPHDRSVAAAVTPAELVRFQQ